MMKLYDKHHLALDCIAVILEDTGHQAIQFPLPTPLQSHCIVKHSCPQFASHYSRPSILHTQSSVV